MPTFSFVMSVASSVMDGLWGLAKSVADFFRQWAGAAFGKPGRRRPLRPLSPLPALASARVFLRRRLSFLWAWNGSNYLRLETR